MVDLEFLILRNPVLKKTEKLRLAFKSRYMNKDQKTQLIQLLQDFESKFFKTLSKDKKAGKKMKEAMTNALRKSCEEYNVLQKKCASIAI